MTRSNTDPSSLTVFAVVLIYSLATIFAVASIYQRYRHSQQHRSVSVNGICSSIDLFISNILRSSSQQFAAVRSSSQQYRSIDVNGICSSTDLSANSILRSSIDLFADIMIRSSTYSSVALRVFIRSVAVL